MSNVSRFNEIIVITDDTSWIWHLISSTLESIDKKHVRLPSSTPIRQSWERLKDTSRIVLHWEAKDRSGGAIVEEIRDVSPNFDVASRIIVLTTNPTREDVVYFSELGLKRIITLRNRQKYLAMARRELQSHVASEPEKDPIEQAWRKLLYIIDTLPKDAGAEVINKLEQRIHQLKPEELSARYLDALASVAALRSDDDLAIEGWHDALEKNPNYFRTYHNLIEFYRSRNRNDEALQLMQKMQELNKSNISRLVGMGEIKLNSGDSERAEFYFKSALDRDRYCSGALNGLAEIRFHQGDLEAARQLLSRSHQAYKTASRLNRAGIELVKENKFQTALEHYTKAQYVLPQQDKGPLLFYNIGLCYSRWGKHHMAREFLRVALIKEPNYRKAKRLLAHVSGQLEDAQIAS